MSREEAIEILSDMRAEYNLFGDEEEATRYHVLSMAIQEMKAKQTERRIGKWIYKERREPQYDIVGVKTWGIIAYFCSECGFTHSVIEDFGHYSYCPNCGAKMVEGEEEC